MKISLRILLINFAIVVLIIGSSAIAFYSIMYQVLASHQSQFLVNSANDFIYAYRNVLLDSEDEFLSLGEDELNRSFTSQKLSAKNIDFIFKTKNVKPALLNKIAANSNVYLPEKEIGLKEFLEYNPYALIQKHTAENGDKFYYGRILTKQLLDEFSQRINSEIAIVWNGIPTDVSNPSINQKHLYILMQANEYLKQKNNFDIYSEGTETNNVIATVYKPGSSGEEYQNDLSFLIFSTIGEAAALRATLKDMFLIIGTAGIALSLIFTFLFTDKLRKQITELSKATESTRSGKFDTKITVKSNDEIGKLGEAFNRMMDELEKKEKSKREYSEFITLINQNPTLKEISEAALQKIVYSCGFTIGALYSVEDDLLQLVSSYGIENEESIQINTYPFFNSVVKNKELIEINSEEMMPVVRTGIVDFKINHLLILPIVYNNKVISVLELGSVNTPSDEVKEYLDKIKEQLAIGLTNAKALKQLENFIAELKTLNEEYQKQNVQIKEQNNTLLELHNELKEQAAELEMQKKKAEELTKVKSQFLASMSHELRTPMNSILGLTELILEKAVLDNRNKERLEVVLSSGHRLMSLINDILDLSKIEAGKMEIRLEDTLIDDIIDEVSNSINPLVIKKGLGFQVVKNINTKVLINTDRGKIVQVLINLLGNAVKFTNQGKVKLEVSGSKEFLEFSVTDTGIGISEEDLKVIFEEFRQADSSTTRKYSGTGLGLTICKKIVELMGGTITVKSKLGEGSEFSFSVPMYISESKIEATQKEVNVNTLIKNKTNPILVVDDDEAVRYTIGQYLNSQGYQVIFAAGGDDGIKKAIENQPFAITLDVMLPDKDGWSTLKELKENPKTKDIPVILVSIMGDKNIGYALGAFEYFVKPISSEKLLAAFSRLERMANKRIQKIVIVDDDEIEFEKFKKEFANDGVRIEYIKDSDLAYSKIAEVQPDLIILDLMMPKMDGITLSYKLKSNPQTKDIPIFISTAKNLTDDEKSSLTNIVEEIAVKSKGHPHDVLKLVRDRIAMQEDDTTDAAHNNIAKPAHNGNNGSYNLANEDTSEKIKGTVLIVDDDSDTLFTLDEIVKACGYKTILANSGTECLSKLEQQLPNVILLDIMMPEMDGFQTLKRIRHNADWQDIPVFAVTAKAMKEDRGIILKHGFNDYIPKPVNPTIISFKIEQIFSRLKAAPDV